MIYCFTNEHVGINWNATWSTGVNIISKNSNKSVFWRKTLAHSENRVKLWSNTFILLWYWLIYIRCFFHILFSSWDIGAYRYKTFFSFYYHITTKNSLFIRFWAMYSYYTHLLSLLRHSIISDQNYFYNHVIYHNVNCVGETHKNYRCVPAY